MLLRILLFNDDSVGDTDDTDESELILQFKRTVKTIPQTKTKLVGSAAKRQRNITTSPNTPTTAPSPRPRTLLVRVLPSLYPFQKIKLKALSKRKNQPLNPSKQPPKQPRNQLLLLQKLDFTPIYKTCPKMGCPRTGARTI